VKNKQLLSIKINLDSYDSFVDDLIERALSDRSSYACVANVHMLIEAHKMASFASVVNNADMVTPDGIPLTWALRFLYGIRQSRVAGMDLLPDLLRAAEKHRISVAFYGGTEEMLAKTRAFLGQSYPEIQIAKMYSPPFRQLSAEEEQTVVDIFNESKARLIFVVLGCPKQERWMASMQNRINATMIGIGGALPVLLGMQKRAPIWMQDSGLEWLFRLKQEPARLFRRYATTNALFIYLVLKEKFSLRKLLGQKKSSG
jgi:N-acetylglucosaminyldiphosphoundecaprenol N-acetyl-beta-D-mannosaminyltransferase